MTHFWTTATTNVMALTMVRYYIDGEKGSDTLTGGAGNDAITVGPDTYDSMEDTITDFFKPK